MLSPFMECVGKDTQTDALSIDLCDDYIMWLREHRKLKDQSINTFLRAVRAFVKYGQDKDYIDKSIKIKCIKVDCMMESDFSFIQLAGNPA